MLAEGVEVEIPPARIALENDLSAARRVPALNRTCGRKSKACMHEEPENALWLNA